MPVFQSSRVLPGPLLGMFLVAWSTSGALAATVPLPSGPADTLSQETDSRIALRSPESAVLADRSGGAGGPNQLQLQAEDVHSGKTLNIDISSQDLTYSAQTGTYTATGEVYIIIPEKNLEILADQVTYAPARSDMVAVGNVFVIRNKKVLGTEHLHYDLGSSVSEFVHPRTVTETFRLKAQSGIRSDQFTILDHGRLILTSEAIARLSERYRNRGGLRFGQASLFSFYSSQRKHQWLGTNDWTRLNANFDSVYAVDGMAAPLPAKSPADANALPPGKPVSPQDVRQANFDTDDALFRVKTRKVTVRRLPKGFDKITLSQTSLNLKGFPVGWSPQLQFGSRQSKNFFTYLGPELSYNRDYGGLYFAPGFDFRFLDGFLKVSPSVSYGGGRRLSGGAGEPEQVEAKPGIGVLAHFRSPNNRTDYNYNTTFRNHVFYTDQQLFRPQTRLRGALNRFVTNGFFGVERPRYIAALTDTETFRFIPNWTLQTYLSAGYAKDNFFPTRQRVFFVDPKNLEPLQTGRLEIQGQLTNNAPLLYLGKVGAIGALGQGRLAAYGTGDFYGVFQGGPYLSLFLGPIFSQTTYLFGQTLGETPFTFDTFYRGRHNIQTINALDLGKFATVGSMLSFNLTRDNARNDLLVDQRFFISFGPKSVKFSFAYDLIQKRSFFGITLNPGGGQAVMDFDMLNLLEPGVSASQLPRNRAVLAPRKTPGG